MQLLTWNLKPTSHPHLTENKIRIRIASIHSSTTSQSVLKTQRKFISSFALIQHNMTIYCNVVTICLLHSHHTGEHMVHGPFHSIRPDENLARYSTAFIFLNDSNSTWWKILYSIAQLDVYLVVTPDQGGTGFSLTAAPVGPHWEWSGRRAVPKCQQHMVYLFTRTLFIKHNILSQTYNSKEPRVAPLVQKNSLRSRPALNQESLTHGLITNAILNILKSRHIS
jgi:hypothetical protein